MGKYLYAIIPGFVEKIFGKIGINDEDVYTIPFTEISAVVSDDNEKEYKLTENNVRKHDAVLRKVMQEYTVIPAEFGTVFYDDKVLKQLLNKAYNPIKECLRLVENTFELGVKAILKKDLVHSNVENVKLSSNEIVTSLKKNAVQSVSGEIFSDRLVLNESFLVNKDRLEAFSEEVALLGESYPMLKFLYSGPWAPYNFVYIRIGKQGIEFKKKV